MTLSPVCRLAPSPTGYMHIGTARTALYNQLFAKRHHGKFLLRIEDTDRERSTPEATQAIFDGLTWLGLHWHGEPVMQFSRAPRHAEVAHQLVKEGKAYFCYCSPEELAEMREEQKNAGQPMRYDGRWRNRSADEAPAGVKPVIRIKAPQEGETVVIDAVLGEIRVKNEQLDDMILLRSDGTPTFHLSVVVDDADMGITHVIRGNDHMTNTFRQLQIYHAMGWKEPVYAHLPMIVNDQGQKLSKRHGAVGVRDFAKMGYLPEALRNYLLRLGWGHGDDEIISDEQAAAWFNLEGISKSPARFDYNKLNALNAHYLQLADNVRLSELIKDFMPTAPSSEDTQRIIKGMASLKSRAKTLVELAEGAKVYCLAQPLIYDEKAKAVLDAATVEMVKKLAERFATVNDWLAPALEECVRNFADENSLKLGKIAQPLRAALTGTTVSPPIFEVAEILGRDVSLKRLHAL